MWFKIFRMDLSAVFLHDTVTDAQTQTRAFTDRFGCVKGIKDTIHVSESIAIIVKTQRHSAIVAAGLDAYFLAGIALQGIDGIIQQIQQNLLELVFIQRHMRQPRLNLYLDVYILVEQMVFAKRQYVL